MNPPTAKDFLFHLTQGNYQTALDLAKELSIDTDLVYKSQWERREEEKDLAKGMPLLMSIKDDAWVVRQCLETLARDSDTQWALLRIGQTRIHALTDTLVQCLKDNPHHPLEDKDKVWLRCRLFLLRYMDRLSTHVKITTANASSVSFEEGYGQFRDCNLIAQAIDYARTENHIGLDAVFMHHGQDVLPHRLFILSQIPETVDPSRFDLPHVTLDHEDAWPEEPWRPHKDPVEAPAVVAVIDPPAREEEDYLSRLHQSIKATEYPAPAHVIAAWYRERAHAMDSVGLSSQALDLIRYAQVMGVSSLEEKAAAYEWLCKYVYASRPQLQQQESVVTLARFEAMDAYEILEGLLSRTTPGSIVQDMQQLVLPWLEVCKRGRGLKRKRKEAEVEAEAEAEEKAEAEAEAEEEEEKAEMLLYRWLLDTCMTQLGGCCAVFEQSKPTLPREERIIKDDVDLSRLVLAILYSSSGTMEYLVRIFECLPIFEESHGATEDLLSATAMDSLFLLAETPLGMFTALQTVGTRALTHIMDSLQSHLMAAEVLERYHATVPLRWYLSDQTGETQRQLCVRMASQAAGGVESGGAQFDRDDDWRELLDDMLRLYDEGQGIFGKIDPSDIMEIFYSSLLRCGQFKLANELILGSGVSKLVPIHKAQQLVIDAAKEFFDNATTGNMYTGNMKQALECLKVLPPTPEIRTEMDLIEATHTLTHDYRVMERPGLVLMPIQVRQCTDRLSLISKLVNTHHRCYQRHQDIVHLTQKLGYQNDLLAEVKVLAMLANAALVDEDYSTSYQLCLATVEKAQMEVPHKPKAYKEDMQQAAWQICFSFGKMNAYHDFHRRLDALGMALTLSPEDYIGDILSVWRRVEKERGEHGLAEEDGLAVGLRAGDAQHQDASGWQDLLQNAKIPQWSLGDLLKRSNPQDIKVSTGSSEQGASGNIRKRDQLMNIVEGWLF
ncbi:secretory pathway protein Sec39-domain-containing protein [Spinellus fusiger]|nr:secretory pathway protein Sec39-domain-containing protein [Spinellus fusiger]